ncbi:DUF2294 domain-containing protein [Microcoleus sp. bin38.metabat.b11b12b14.051]|uniref:DUF2294 domain-containing protein n=1 Tax=Microcoleus sp. bin38.metabat.b11b12b14.051 TaxID=2742709 RepID=UPI0025D5E4B3|nr:DUF2294 domain-containing protein [Microcoleus sp. bin38.metabat.b11b12b14.051]
MTGETSVPTRGTLERSLAQGIQALYRSLLGHQTSQALCNLLDNKLIIVIENAITQPEKALVHNGQEDLAAQVRSQLESVLELPLKELIKQVLGVGVTDLLSDATLETGRTGTIAILESAPKVRDAISKSKTPLEATDG